MDNIDLFDVLDFYIRHHPNPRDPAVNRVIEAAREARAEVSRMDDGPVVLLEQRDYDALMRDLDGG